MRQGIILTLFTAVNIIIAASWMGTTAQTPLPPPAQPLVLTQADIRHMLKINKEDTSLGSVDAGKHVVDVWLDQRNAIPKAAGSAQAHSELTEIYVVQRGNATLKAGGAIHKPTYVAALPRRISPGGAMFVTPTWSGPPEGGRTWDVGPGDIVVLPPGAVHQWATIPQEMRYVILRIDPEHKQKAGFVQPLLTQ